MKTIKYTTGAGIEIEIKAISPDYMAELDKQVPMPEPPTYERTLLGGETEVIAHTKDSVETEEEKLAWAEYEMKLAIARSELFMKKARAIVKKCVDVEMPKDEAWIIAQQEDGINVPEDPSEKKRHYIKTECIASESDIFFVVEAARKLSRFDAEDYAKALDFFRTSVRGETDQ